MYENIAQRSHFDALHFSLTRIGVIDNDNDIENVLGTIIFTCSDFWTSDSVYFVRISH